MHLPALSTCRSMGARDEVKHICSLLSASSSFHFTPSFKTNRQRSPSASDAAAWQRQLGQRLLCPWQGSGTELTYDTELCTGEDDAVPVLRHALVHPGVRETHVGNGERALLQLHSALGEQRNKLQNKQGDASSEHKPRGCRAVFYSRVDQRKQR